jgi:thioredoxin-like negative regulator of GroEL
MRSAMQSADWSAAISAAEAWRHNGGRDWRITLNQAVCASRIRHGPENTWLQLVQEALQQSGHAPIALLAASEVHCATGQWEEALALVAELEQRRQAQLPWEAIRLRCEALGRLGQTSRALEELLQWPPGQRDWRWQMAKADAHVQANQWQEAEHLYTSVLAERPHQPEAHLNLALALLSQQRCAEAWPHYEWRRSNPRLNQWGIPETLPSLASLIGQDVVVVGEQGIGDQVMACRYLRHLACACRSVHIEPAPRLAPLLQRSLPNTVAVVSPGASPQDALVIGMASLSMLFWQELGLAAQDSKGYLQADRQRVENWRKHLVKLPLGHRLGIGWLGGSTGAERRERSLCPADLQLLGKWPNVQWFDLQYLPAGIDPQATVSGQAGMHRLGNPGSDIEETMALIQSLDGVLTTRQTVAHLAGALGKPGQVLVPARPEWRYWGVNNRWAWYPSLTLIQQEVRGTWEPALRQASHDWRFQTWTTST